MKTNYLLLTIALIAIINNSYSQVPVGEKYDINGVPFNGYFDVLDYAPKSKISIGYNDYTFEEGYYYDKSNKKIQGFIKYDNKKIWFKDDKNDLDDIKIKPDEVNALVIGVDSFIVISNFYLGLKLKTEKQFALYISTIDSISVVKHYDINRDFTGAIYGLEEKFLAKHDNRPNWEHFSNKEKYEAKMLEYFGNNPIIKSKLNSKDYDPESFYGFIKVAEYYQKFVNQDSLYFDKFFHETNIPELKYYSATIASATDTLWTIVLFRNSSKVSQVQLSSLYPVKKQGRLISFNENGTIRKIVEHEKNRPVLKMIFDARGNLVKSYEIEESKNESDDADNEIEIKYITISDSTGKNLLDDKSAIKYTFIDTISKKLHTETIRNKSIKSASYLMNDTDTVFQQCDTDFKFKTKPFQRKIDDFISDQKLKEVVRLNVNGILLLNVVVDPKGYATHFELLNTLHPEIDSLIMQFANTYLSPEAVYPVKFKPYKINKQKRYCEYVIPIEFSVNKLFQIPRNNYYNHWHFHHFHHQQMQQQMHQQHMQHMQSTMPRGF